MFDELWSEIADAPGEIFDVIDFKEEWEQEDDKFDVEKLTSTVTEILKTMNNLEMLILVNNLCGTLMELLRKAHQR